jgi:NADH:ubiquinone oxidoreductase subunit F (NADH-binding)
MTIPKVDGLIWKLIYIPWVKPPVGSNVETLVKVAVILEQGTEWFKVIGAHQHPGTKVFTLTGEVVTILDVNYPPTLPSETLSPP